ncbi:MAG TPA: TIGR00730 family Rossman fold protein [Caldithrix abyssi]|uniref:Cytokinin riboside 5'-monophosphate phosphoribohydrolase n=1 Tax=Caldithrix abyssi TaxID=187145 RepID=A0A7V5PR32_CALAY|nr:TIGR00730 family Rossman fold protein [Caldithrix abyssi]
MKSVAVFCGSSPGRNGIYLKAAQAVGMAVAGSGLTLIYGGAKVGLMTALADSALSRGARVIGVMPRFLIERGVAHEGLSRLIQVDTMHQRKAKIMELADGFIALPGGFGTQEELFEMLTLAQLQQHSKPVAILNVNGFYDPFLAFQQKMLNEGFVKSAHKELLLVDSDINLLLEKMNHYRAPDVPK